MFGKKDETKERWNKLVKEIAPEDVYKNAESFAATVFEDSWSGVKVFKKDALTEKEQKKLCESLQDEYNKQVFEPCRKIFLDFCEKYGIIPVESGLRVFGIRDYKGYMMMLAAKEMTGRLKDKLENALKGDL
jgi:hypothetical protein